MQIALIGAGNMGCVYGAHAARVDEEVTMVDTWTDGGDAGPWPGHGGTERDVHGLRGCGD